MSQSADNPVVTLIPMPDEQVLARVGEREFTVPAACPHRKGRLAYATINPNTMRITCTLHRSTYDLTTGCQVSGPAARDLAVRPRAAGSTYRPQEVWLPASEALTEWGEDFHDLMLGDNLRMTAFATAIREVVRPGSIVVDLGTGTGILARWALEAGAARVYGIDFNKHVLDTAVKHLAAAGFGPDRFVPLRGMSFDIELPERADVIVSETLGNIADNEGCVRILADARARFLAVGGALIPFALDSYLVPVDARAAHKSIACGRIKGGACPGNRFGTYYDVIVQGAAHLATPRLARHYEFTAAETDEYTISRSYLVHRDGLMTGFKGYFVADLSPTVTMDISGDDIWRRLTSDSWKHCFLPIEHPVEVQARDRVALTFSRATRGEAGSFEQRYRWAGTVLRGRNVLATFNQSSG